MIKTLRYHSRKLVRELGFLNKNYSQTNTSFGETHALIEINNLGELEVGELATKLNIDKSGASRIMSAMEKKNWIKPAKVQDQRVKRYQLNPKGKKLHAQIDQQSNCFVENALQELSNEQQEKIVEGIMLYAQALKKARIKQEYTIRVIEDRDNKQMAKIVREALKELNLLKPGTAASDPSLDYLSKFFVGERKTYLVAEKDGKIYGGAGITALQGGPQNTCELIRMFLHKKARGSGIGQLLIEEALRFAKEQKYTYCYLETTEEMLAAQKLYQRNGFEYLKERMGDTGHFACKVLMGRKI